MTLTSLLLRSVMKLENRKTNLPYDLSSMFRGTYSRVARSRKVDISYVSRVARGERRSNSIQAAIDRETRQIMKKLKLGYNTTGSIGASRRSTKTIRLKTI
jgi:hypothetical protein